MPEVDVIIGVYNGEKYLSNMLQSIRDQKGVKVNLIVSDDGSHDNSIVIAEEFSSDFNSFVQVYGSAQGPAENFLSALKYSKSKYLAFADQDDIWCDDHLVNSVNRLQKFDLIPALTFCAVGEFKGTSKKAKIWPRKRPTLELHALITENPARGCTIVMNKLAVSRIKDSNPTNVIMHDWWSVLLIKLVGEVIYSELPEVWYRVHADSVTVNSRRFKQRVSRLLLALKGNWPIVTQLNSLMNDSNNYNVDPITKKQLDLFSQNNRKSIIFYPRRFRMGLIDEVAIRILLLIRWLIHEEK